MLGKKQINISEYPELIRKSFFNRVIWGYIATGALLISLFKTRSLPFIACGIVACVVYWGLIFIMYYQLTRDKLLYLEGTADKIVNGITKYIRYIQIKANSRVYRIPYKMSYNGRYEDGCLISLYIAHGNIYEDNDGVVMLENPLFITFNSQKLDEDDEESIDQSDEDEMQYDLQYEIEHNSPETLEISEE